MQIFIPACRLSFDFVHINFCSTKVSNIYAVTFTNHFLYVQLLNGNFSRFYLVKLTKRILGLVSACTVCFKAAPYLPHHNVDAQRTVKLMTGSQGFGLTCLLRTDRPGNHNSYSQSESGPDIQWMGTWLNGHITCKISHTFPLLT